MYLPSDNLSTLEAAFSLPARSMRVYSEKANADQLSAVLRCQQTTYKTRPPDIRSIATLNRLW
jgi:hypothetical protein